MKASHKKYTVLLGFKEVQVNPGQFIFGRRKAAKELSLSEQEIRTCVRFLEKIKNLTQTATQRYSIISIVNWDTYQEKENRINPNINQLLTHSQPIANHIQEHKAQEEIKDTPIPPKGASKKKPSGLSPELQESFSRFWSAYPKHVSKITAEKAWLKISPQNGLVEAMCSAIERFKQSHDWKKDGGQFIPMPSTWLNQRRWEDELIAENNGLDLEYWKNI